MVTRRQVIEGRRYAAGRDKDIFEKLENLIRHQFADERSVSDILTALGTPIVSVAILDSGEITATIFGPEQSRPGISSPDGVRDFDDNTLFQAASISKAITALAVIKLCQEQKLDLDAPISRYLSIEQLSWISTPSTESLVKHISLRQLLSHTSGLRVPGFNGYPPNTSLLSLQQIFLGLPLANNESITLSTLPGHSYAYSGGGYTLIGLIISSYFRAPYPDILGSIVLQPLNMSRSTYTTPLLPSETNYAPAYLTRMQKSDPEYHIYPETAAAALWTTPSDLLRAISAIQRALRGEEDFLERKWVQMMLTEVGENEEGMALGWSAKRGGVRFLHGGSNPPGYKCLVFGYADLSFAEPSLGERVGKRGVPVSCGVAVMTSSALGNPVVVKVVSAICALKGWPDVLDGIKAVPFLDRGRKEPGCGAVIGGRGIRV